MITGNTRLFAIIADPVGQVRTPEVLNHYFAQNGVDAILVPVHVSPEGLQSMLAAFRAMKNLGGFVVTVPHKTAVAELCDELGDAGQAIGSVNTVRRTADGRLIGDMFDGAGFVKGLESRGHDPAGAKVLLLGAGGAASAIAFALAQAGVASLTIANRTKSRAQELADRIGRYFPELAIDVVDRADPAGHDYVVNATSLGMRANDPLPIDANLLRPGMIVAEIIMKPESTRLLDAARQKGCAVHYGRHMLDHQVQLMGEFMLAPG